MTAVVGITRREAVRGGRTSRRGRTARAVGLGAVTGLVTALLVGGVSYALWDGDAPFSGGTITSGDLNMSVGTPTWEQVTPGVTQGASGTLGSTPTDFFSMPGDVIEISQPVTTTLVGDNLAGGFTVSFADEATGSADVEAGLIAVSFHVEDDEGNQVAPATGEAQFGEVVEVPGLVGDDDGNVADWTVVIRVDVLGDYVWTDQAVTADPATWNAGDITVSLNQIREGEGFTAGGAG